MSKLKRKIKVKAIEVNGVLLECVYCKSDEDFKKYELQAVRSLEDIMAVLEDEVIEYIEDNL